MTGPGAFITLEGGEGSGKTTVIGKIGEYFNRLAIPYMMTREPGGIEIAEKIREIILNPSHTAMDARTEALLYAASRRQHLAEKVEPALEKGLTVICDRFVDSSLVYQGYARGLGMDEVWAINQFAIHDRMPDLTFYLDIEPETGLQRIAANQGREVNRLDLEGLSFHQKVREGYHIIASRYPERIVVIDASKEQSAVEQDIIRVLQERF
ncbi:dTMP kinase [Paenibacillus rhizosphaerae]|uniref:Thymidylate kinase n=2 Tax=Paenibacillus TaxID=44249 RepID=A0A1R1E263_9BACL|nr:MULTISPECIES: dTMP kinase [Paenibacillus]MBJ9993319.1 dTMP kinase [Paenibacillus sp. S28]MCM3002135.1 dTMP kinase [Paenibacillus cellulositrophicus]MEC0179060.1 dTMP kinase [Paenibacillus favisporus]OMF45923.1 dTMP kinase [Paenibacillus rhizosphaerae]RED29787.1 dTMP kinase [Paenibacillus sp. VMFN-D1]